MLAPPHLIRKWRGYNTQFNQWCAMQPTGFHVHGKYLTTCLQRPVLFSWKHPPQRSSITLPPSTDISSSNTDMAPPQQKPQLNYFVSLIIAAVTATFTNSTLSRNSAKRSRKQQQLNFLLSVLNCTRLPVQGVIQAEQKGLLGCCLRWVPGGRSICCSG